MSKKNKNNNLLYWIFEQTEGYRLKITFLNISSLVSAGISIILIYVFKILVDQVTSGNISMFLKICVVVLILVITEACLSFVSKALSQKMKQDMVMKIRGKVFEHVLRSEYSKISKFHTGDLISRLMSDVQIVSEGCTELLPSFIFLIFKFIFATALVIKLFGAYTLIFVAIYLAICAVIAMMKQKIKALHKGVQEKYAENQSFLQESLACLLTVKTFSKEETIRNKFSAYQKDFMDFRLKRWLFNSVANMGLKLAVGGIYFIVMIVGCLGIFYKRLSFGSFFAAFQLINQLQAPFFELPGILSRYYALIASAERIDDLRSIEEEPSENIPWEKTYSKLKSFNCENIYFNYEDKEVLKGTSLSVKKGETIAIKGVSGCGKSTLFLIMLSAYKALSGNIYFELKDESISMNPSYRTMFAYVPQGSYMMQGTIKDNITFFNKEISNKEIEEALRISCSKEFVEQLPNGINTILSEKGAGLSAGQLQRLSIARAILRKSPILLLDEATSALDEETEKNVLENIKNMQDKTILIVTHGEAALNICDRIVCLENGKISEIK